MAGICGAGNASECMQAQVGGGIALICMHVFVRIDNLQPYILSKHKTRPIASSSSLVFPPPAPFPLLENENRTLMLGKLLWICRTNLFDIISG